MFSENEARFECVRNPHVCRDTRRLQRSTGAAAAPTIAWVGPSTSNCACYNQVTSAQGWGTFSSGRRLKGYETNGGAPLPTLPSHFGDGLSAPRESPTRRDPCVHNVRSPVRDRSAGPDGAYPKQRAPPGSSDECAAGIAGTRYCSSGEAVHEEGDCAALPDPRRPLPDGEDYGAPIPDILKTTGMTTKSCTASKIPCAMIPGMRFLVR
jgi:hypothetical protein